MANNRVLRGDVTIWLAEPEAFADPSSPTAAEMAVTALVHDISAAVEDSYTLNQTDSATDDSLSIVDTGNVSTPTFANYSASLDLFADEDNTANGVYNKAWSLTRVKDRDYYAIKRVNKDRTSAVETGDILYIYRVTTDNMQLLLDRGAAVKWGARFKPQGEVYSDVEVAA